jgi:predicted ArsR family transcriptional regulator
MAERAVLAHLEKLVADGVVVSTDHECYLAAQ